LRQRHGFEHGFPLIRSLRASAPRSTSALFSFVLCLLIVAGSFAIRQSKTILARNRLRCLFELALVLVRFDHVARRIINANDGIAATESVSLCEAMKS
jgi:hypothetical protein